MKEMTSSTTSLIIFERYNCKINKKMKPRTRKKMISKNKSKNFNPKSFLKKTGCYKAKLKPPKGLLIVFSNISCSLKLELGLGKKLLLNTMRIYRK
jgi:hypothetical protein